MKRCPRCGLVFPDESTFCFLSGDTLQPAEDPLVGTSIDGRFRVESPLAETPWSRVYAGRYRLLTQTCVIKLFDEPLDAEAQPRFSKAVADARRCSHPNVGELAGGGFTEDGRGFVVHRRLDGAPLAQLLSRGPLGVAPAVGLSAQLLRALGRIHDFGAVHGSLRPSNVLVSPQGHAWVIDVGLGRSSLFDAWEIDPRAFAAQQYLAPEVSSRERGSVGADLYALGATVFQMLTGALPIEADDVNELRAQLADNAPDLGAELAAVPEPIAAWVVRLLARSVRKRPSNAHHALQELFEACQRAGLVPEDDPGPPPAAADVELDRSFARWARFGELFAKMVSIGFPAGPPQQTNAGLQMILGRVEQLVELGRKALYHHQTLNDVLARARQGRETIARQMDELNAGAQNVRKELQPLRVASERHGVASSDFPLEVRKLHREALRWEGRSAFAEPYKELAQAYRKLADVVDRWWEVRQAQLGCDREAEAHEERLRLIEAEHGELRQALKVHESNLAAEIDACDEALRSLGKEADRIELELLDLASRFSAPLRSKPELGECFRELTRVA